MKIPKYVIELMRRAEYNYNSIGNGYSVGYTVDIAKYSNYEKIDTFRCEIGRLKKWVEKQEGGKMEILSLPIQTKHNMQYGTVTIYDPVMQKIEKYINN